MIAIGILCAATNPPNWAYDVTQQSTEPLGPNRWARTSSPPLRTQEHCRFRRQRARGRRRHPRLPQPHQGRVPGQALPGQSQAPQRAGSSGLREGGRHRPAGRPRRDRDAAQATIDVIRQCGEADVRAAVVLSAGFRETGEAGVRLERQLKETAAHYNLRLIGPNCLGMMRPRVGIDATFLDTPRSRVGSRWCRSRGRCARPSSTGPGRATSASRRSCPWATPPTSTSATSSTTSRWTADRCDPAVHRGYPEQPGVHERPAGRRAHEARDRAQGRPPRVRLQGSCHPHRCPDRLGRRVRRPPSAAPAWCA